MHAKTVFALAILAAGAVAQDSTSTAASATPSVATCVMNCITSSIEGSGCTGVTDMSCLCTNVKFQTAAMECLQDKCTADEQASALELQQNQCSNVGSSSSTTESASATGSQSATSSGSVKPTSTSPTSSKPTSSGASSSGAASTSNAALRMGPATGLLAVVAGFIGVAL